MKLDKKMYEEIRADLRQQLVRACRIGVHEEHRIQRRISRLDMCFMRHLDWTDIKPGDIIEVYSTETAHSEQ